MLFLIKLLPTGKMDSDLLIKYIEDPKSMDRESLLQLRQVLDEYPCFTVARMLYLKNLELQNDIRFGVELSRTSVSVPERKRLYYFMEDKYPAETEVADNTNVSSFSIIDSFLRNTEPEEGNSINTAISGVEKVNETFDLDYVDYMSYYPNKNNTESDIPMIGQELIDAFLENPQTEINSNSAEEINEENFMTELPESSFTETLARIYLKQKRYDKALEIIRSLSLKYPEKNVYFADQIRFLEKLIINTKKI